MLFQSLTILTLLPLLTAAFNITTLHTSAPLNATSDPGCNTTVSFVVHDINTYNASAGLEQTAETTCTATWPAFNGTIPSGWMDCVDDGFQWMFGNEENDIEGYKGSEIFGFSITHGWEEPGQGYLEEFGWTVANSSSLTCEKEEGRKSCHLKGGKKLIMPIYIETL